MAGPGRLAPAPAALVNPMAGEDGPGGFRHRADGLFEEPDRFIHGRERAEGGYVHVAVQDHRREGAQGNDEGGRVGGPASAQEDIQRNQDRRRGLEQEEVSLPDPGRVPGLVSGREMDMDAGVDEQGRGGEHPQGHTHSPHAH